MLASCGSGNGGDGSPGEAGYQPVPRNGGLGNVEMNFATLVNSLSSAQAARTPWAGSWWPYADGGISDAARLYERAHGASGATDWELSHHGPSVPGLQSWFGHCNGWAAAAVLTPEPRQAVKDGSVSFGVADQKALLSEIGMEVNGDFFGTRVNDAGDLSSPAFEDVYPDQFFLVLTNYVGRGFPLVIDRYTGNQVWNQPVAAYRIDPVTPGDDLGADPSAPNVHRVKISMTVWWARDDVTGDHQTEPFAFADGPSFESRTLRGEIWLDGPAEFDSSGALKRSGNVILARQGDFVTGGAWTNGGLPAANSHPDYIWRPTSYRASSGYSNQKIDQNWVLGRFGGR